MKINVQVFVGHIFSFLLLINILFKLLSIRYFYVELLEELLRCFSKWLHHFTFSPTTYKCSSFPTLSLTMLLSLTLAILSLFFILNPSNRCEVISHVVLICKFLMINDVDHLFFPVFIDHLYSCFREMFIQKLHSF